MLGVVGHSTNEIVDVIKLFVPIRNLTLLAATVSQEGGGASSRR